ncbi:MAG: ABC transporter substrate-binding protein [Bacillota bacterium]|jgi:peptide/nickel transport system substrate-binding protein|nr:ABC transporter substrate-binding protein [Bacillota bacterium]
MLLTLVAACGNKTSDPTTKANEETEKQPSTNEGDTEEGLLRYTLASMPKIDPGVGSDFASASVIINLYDPLLQPTQDGSVKPWIATEWDVSDDGLVWTFKIRDDVKFHSGNPLTAKDVAYTMNRMLTLGEGFGYLFASTVEEAVAVDDTTVEFRCSIRNGTLSAALVRLYILDSALVETKYAEGTYGDKGDYGKAFLLENDAGSGPYKLKEYAANAYILAEQYPEYWAGLDPNNPKGFKAYGSNESVTVKTMMQRRELEIADTYQSAETNTALDAIEGIDIMNTKGGNIIFLILNNSKPPLDDPHVRKALAYMMDYDTIYNDIFPGSTVAESIICSTLRGHKKMYDFTYDIEKAKEEIALSKYKDNIADYPIEVCWIAETPDREKLALLIQAVAAQVGVNVKVVKTPWAKVVENAASPDTTPHVTTTVFTGDYSEAGSVLMSAIRSKEVGTWQNCSWINDDVLDAMIDESITIIDDKERIAKYEEIQDYLADKVVMIPLAEVVSPVAYQSAYIDWDSGNPELQAPVMGYILYMREIRIYPDRK